MEQIQIFQYNENPVSFQMGAENRMINATQMAKPFGKRVQHFLGTEQTKEFMNVLSQSRNLGFDKLVIVTKGGRSAGTWLHEVSPSYLHNGSVLSFICGATTVSRNCYALD